jgi:hypothetical protein
MGLMGTDGAYGPLGAGVLPTGHTSAPGRVLPPEASTQCSKGFPTPPLSSAPSPRKVTPVAGARDDDRRLGDRQARFCPLRACLPRVSPLQVSRAHICPR